MSHQAQAQADGHPGVESVAERVTRIVAEVLGFDVDEVAADATLVEDLGADSLDRVQLSLGLEDAFDLEIPDQDAAPLRTVADVISYIERRTAAQAITG